MVCLCSSCKVAVVEFAKPTVLHDSILFPVDEDCNLRQSCDAEIVSSNNNAEGKLAKELSRHNKVCVARGKGNFFSFLFEPIAETEIKPDEECFTTCSYCLQRIKEEYLIDGHDICRRCLTYNRNSRGFLENRIGLLGGVGKLRRTTRARKNP